MYVCLCKCVTDCQIREAVCDGACSMRDLHTQLGVATQCGRCAQHARRVLEESLSAAPGANDKVRLEVVIKPARGRTSASNGMERTS